MDGTALISAFVTLFVVIDPPGLAPLFVALTQGMGSAQRRTIAIRACVIAAVLMTLFGAFGEALLGFVGISMPAFRIAGGALLFLTAMDMLFERRQPRRQGQTANHPDDPSVFPLATPLIAGPGALATMILLTGQARDWQDIAWIHAIMVAVLLLVFVLCLAAGLMERILGDTGINVVTRLLGMLLAALSVQFILDGLKAYGFAG